MDVRNFTQFSNLLASTQTIHMHPAFDRLFTCMTAYNGLCACGGSSNQEKSNKHGECNRIYREAIGALDSIKAHLFLNSADNTISFYIDDSHHIRTLFR
jgi:hypothetical protein